jgi:hypothetical protein
MLAILTFELEARDPACPTRTHHAGRCAGLLHRLRDSGLQAFISGTGADMLDAQDTSAQDARSRRIRGISLDGEYEVACVEIPGQPN